MMVVNTTDINGFKETEIGLIPVEWQVAILKNTVEFTRKPRGLDLSHYEMIPFVPMECIPDNGVHINSFLPKAPDEIGSGTYCEKGDFLLAKITPSFENGKQAIIENIPTNVAYATTEVYAFKPLPDRLDRMFLFHHFRQAAVRTDIAGRMEGTTGRQRIPKTVIEHHLIPLPPLPEQRRIAAVLNAIQDAIATQEDVIAAAREFKRSLMQRLFTYGPKREAAETKETEIGEIPAHWEVVELVELLAKTQYGLNSRAELQGQYPVLRMNNLVGGVIDVSDLKYVTLDNAELNRYRLNKGDILFNRTNSYELVGKTSIFNVKGEYTFASYLVRVVPHLDRLIPEYLNYCLNSDSVQARLKKLATRGVSQSNISPTKLKRLNIGLPPTCEQHEIASILADVDHKIAAEEDRKTALQSFFKSTLHQLMTGQIRLRSDEGLPL